MPLPGVAEQKEIGENLKKNSIAHIVFVKLYAHLSISKPSQAPTRYQVPHDS